jgi:hypothetical protein
LDNEVALYLLVFKTFPNDRDLHTIRQAIEFCTDKHTKKKDNIYGKTDQQLSDAQIDLLDSIHELVRDWLDDQLAAAVETTMPVRRRRRFQ